MKLGKGVNGLMLCSSMLPATPLYSLLRFFYENIKTVFLISGVWMDTLDAHNQAFLAGSVCLGFMALCAVLCCCCRKMGSRHTITRAPPMLLRDDGL